MGDIPDGEVIFSLAEVGVSLGREDPAEGVEKEGRRRILESLQEPHSSVLRW